jgi:GAF domain-containing protein
MPQRIEVPAYAAFISYGITITAVTALLYLAIRSISSAAQKAIANEQAQREINQQLEESRTQLEEKTGILEKRTLALQAVADLAKITSEVNDESTLLNEVARLIPDRLGFLHAGIYLMDAIGEFAVLMASNSDAGQALIADQYQLKVARGELAFIASGTELLRYRIGGQTYRLTSPMPVTGIQSNISFPLIAGERLLGLLNIQAGGQIQEEEQRILHTFADQLALSIQNIRLLAQLQERLRQISALAGQSVRQAWEAVSKGELIGYQYDRLRLLPSGDTLPEDAIQGLKGGKSIVYTTKGKEARTRLVAPLILRDEVIGILGYEDNDPAREWRADEKNLLETIASQVSLALENSRLVTEAQQRAEREQVVSEIIGRIATAIDMDGILKSTVKELGQLVGDSEIAVQLVTGEKKQ